MINVDASKQSSKQSKGKMTPEQEQAVYDVLWDYYCELKRGGKQNIYIHNLGEAYPEIAKKAKRKVR